MWQFIDVFKKVKNEQIQDDDFSDRLSHRYTVVLLLIFCVLVGTTQYVGQPISCWTPSHFSMGMNSYTNSICWISNTYYVPMEENLQNPTHARQFRINYYQWVPFILSLMALLFFSPWATWHVLSKSACCDVKSVMKIVSMIDHGSTESRDKSIRNIVKIVVRSIENSRGWYGNGVVGCFRRWVNFCLFPMYRRTGSYLCSLYMFIKLMYLVNVFGQFFLLNKFMGPDYNVYGLHVVRDLWNGNDFWESSRFPRITMCDFTIRTLGNNNQVNTIQCTLPINLFNEKIFTFLWFWLVLVACFSFYNFVFWFYYFTSSSRISFVKRYLRIGGRLAYARKREKRSHLPSKSSIVCKEKLLHLFVFNYLKHDGLFLLRNIKNNTNDLIIGDLISALWEQFIAYQKFFKNTDVDGIDDAVTEI